jgi:hypothetical protein
MSTIPEPERPGTGRSVPDVNTPDTRLPGDDQGVADRPGYPDDDDDFVKDEPDSETNDTRAEPGTPI